MVSSSPIPTTEQLQARLAHLNMIQAVISRMAGYSAAVKNFMLTITAAIVAIAFDKDMSALLYAGIGVTLVFGFLDAYYLAVEKCFRVFYTEVASRPWSEAFDLNIRQRAVRSKDVLLSTTSVSVWVFYAALLVSFAALPHVLPHVHPNSPPVQRQHLGAARPDEPTQRPVEPTEGAIVEPASEQSYDHSSDRGGAASAAVIASPAQRAGDGPDR